MQHLFAENFSVLEENIQFRVYLFKTKITLDQTLDYERLMRVIIGLLLNCPAVPKGNRQ